MLFLSYEEMKQDLASVITKLGKFLDKTIEGDMLEKLLEAVHIDSMRKNRGVNKADEIKVSWTVVDTTSWFCRCQTMFSEFHVLDKGRTVWFLHKKRCSW